MGSFDMLGLVVTFIVVIALAAAVYLVGCRVLGRRSPGRVDEDLWDERPGKSDGARVPRGGAHRRR